MQKSLLDWALGGANPVQPVGQFVGLSLGTPTSIASNEIATGSGYSRVSCAFPAAGTPANANSVATTPNSTSLLFGPFSSSAVINGVFIADTVSSGAGTMLVRGGFIAAKTPLPGDYLVIAAGGLNICLN